MEDRGREDVSAAAAWPELELVVLEEVLESSTHAAPLTPGIGCGAWQAPPASAYLGQVVRTGTWLVLEELEEGADARQCYAVTRAEPVAAGRIGPTTRVVTVAGPSTTTLERGECKGMEEEAARSPALYMERIYRVVLDSLPPIGESLVAAPDAPRCQGIHLLPYECHPYLTLWPPAERTALWTSVHGGRLGYDTLVVGTAFLLRHCLLNGALVLLNHAPSNGEEEGPGSGSASPVPRWMRLLLWDAFDSQESRGDAGVCGYVHPAVLQGDVRRGPDRVYTLSAVPAALPRPAVVAHLTYTVVRTAPLCLTPGPATSLCQPPLAEVQTRFEHSLRERAQYVLRGSSIPFLCAGQLYHMWLAPGEGAGSVRLDANTGLVASSPATMPPPRSPATARPSATWACPIVEDHGPMAAMRETLRLLLRLGRHVECLLVHGPRRSGKTLAARLLAQEAGLHASVLNCWSYLLHEREEERRAALQVDVQQLLVGVGSQLLILQHVDAFVKDMPALKRLLAWLREACTAHINAHPGTRVQVLCTMSAPPTPALCPLFKYRFPFDTVSAGNRAALCRLFPLHAEVDVRQLADGMAAFVLGDVVRVLQEAMTRAVARTRKVHGLDAGAQIKWEDVQPPLTAVKGRIATEMASPTIPNVAWEDIGGLHHVKQAILKTIQLPLQYPHLFASRSQSGILLYGPPGTGKTLVAKAVATTFDIHFFSVKGPELLNMYIGESEANIRAIFAKARSCSPCVLFFDELDSIAPNRGMQGDSGGVMDRMVAQLLAELDDCVGVFVMGATNRPDLIDPALLRPGRFDSLLYLGVCETVEARLGVLRALVRKFPLDPALDLATIAAQCPPNYTGADFYALCAAALLSALVRRVGEVEAAIPVDAHGRPTQSFNAFVEACPALQAEVGRVGKADFALAFGQVKPSVSMVELERYLRIKERFEQREE